MCDQDYNDDFIETPVNLTRQYIITTPGNEGPPGPTGEVPTPITSDNLFDI